MRAEESPPEWSVTRTVRRPRAMWRLMRSRICASSSSISRGRFTEISLCLRFTELNSTVILNPSWEQSERPYPVIDFIRQKYGENCRGTRTKSILARVTFKNQLAKHCEDL